MQKFEKGDEIAIVSLSSGILGEISKEQLNFGINAMKNLDFNPIFMPNSLKGIEFIKNNPEARANDLKESFYNPNIKGILCAIGGFDTYKILPYLFEDKKFLEFAKKNPKFFLGYSDTTINHMFFHKIGVDTYYGMNFIVDFCEQEGQILPFTKQNIENLSNETNTLKIAHSNIWYEDRKDYSAKQNYVKRISHKDIKDFEFLRGKGIYKGKLLGGCLESLYSIICKEVQDEKQREIFEKYDIFPTELDWKNKILFIETAETKSNPNLYRKMIQSLKEKHVFNNIKAIIVGKPIDEIYYDEYKQILLDETKEFNLPIVYNLNFGHALPHIILPYNKELEINFDTKELVLTNGLFG